MDVLVGLDLGTSSVKAVVMRRDGRLLAAAGEETTLYTPQPGWAEQDPQDWLAASLRALQRAVAESGVSAQQVAGVGVTGQMHSLVCLDGAGEVLRPAILWADSRSQPQVDALLGSPGADVLAAWTGNPLAAGMMLVSWLWLRQNEADTARRTRWLVSPKDYLRWQLSGALGTEDSDASATLLFDPFERYWSQPVLDLAGLREENLPNVNLSARAAAGLRTVIASACGLRAGTPVVFGASDQAARAVGQGLLDEGWAAVTIGTGGQIFAPVQDVRAAARQAPHRKAIHLFCHALPDRWHLQAATLSAGLSLRWLRDQLWPGSDYAGLAEAAQGVEAAQEGLFFLPHLAGERTPHLDSSVRGLFAGLSLSHQRAHLTRAVMEGVVFSLRQGLDALTTAGAPFEGLLLAGGALRHPLWVRLAADILGQAVFTTEREEITACGAAMLAGVGSGVYADVRAAVQQAVPPLGQPVLPDPQRAERYTQAYARYCRLYPALRQAGFARPA